MFYPTENYSEEYIKQLNIKEEKRQIQKAANLLGVAFLIMTAIMVFWSAPLGFVAGLGIVDQNKIFKILEDTTVLQAIQIVVSSVSFIFSFWFYAKVMKARITDVCAFGKPKEVAKVFPFVVLGLGVCGLSNFLTSMAGGLFQSMGFEYNLKLPENPTNLFGIILTYVAVSITPALVEEFAIRGVVLGVLRKYGDSFAIMASALVFGLMHGNFAQIPFAFILGVYFGYVVIKTGSVWPAVIIHFLNNFLSVTIDYLTKEFSDVTKSTITLVYIMLLMVIGVFGLALLYKKGEKDFSVDKNSSLLTTGEKIKTALLAPCMIITYVVVLIEAIFVYV